MPVEAEGLVAQPVLAAKRLLGVLVATTADEARDATRLVLERAAPIIALTIAEARQAARASELGRDIATIDLVSRREGDTRRDRERMRAPASTRGARTTSSSSTTPRRSPPCGSRSASCGRRRRPHTGTRPCSSYGTAPTGLRSGRRAARSPAWPVR